MMNILLEPLHSNNKSLLYNFWPRQCILSCSQTFQNNNIELKVFGRHWESNPGPLA